MSDKKIQDLRRLDAGEALLNQGLPVLDVALPPPEEVAERQFRRGYSDACAGHSPALLGGPYMKGYAEGRLKQGRPLGLGARGAGAAEERREMGRTLPEDEDHGPAN